VSVLVVAQSSSEIPEGLTNNPVYYILPKLPHVTKLLKWILICEYIFFQHDVKQVYLFVSVCKK
jgi:hypothetical protein